MFRGVITAFRLKKNKSEYPFRVLVDGKPDPRNRDFRDLKDIRDCYEYLQIHGFYVGYKIRIKKDY